jgi:AraC family transcriptional regulator, exoenzyme S synthesis regulatory protein ExsA
LFHVFPVLRFPSRLVGAGLSLFDVRSARSPGPAMLNLYESVRTDPSFHKLEIGDLLFAEYTCPIGQDKLRVWTHSDYLVHVLSGRKTWHTGDGTWIGQAGDTLFFRKGAAIIEQFFEADFCVLMFFLPDGPIRAMIRELAGSLPGTPPIHPVIRSVERVHNDVALAAFFQSVRTYFSGREKPSEVLLRLKLNELILSILTGGMNPGLAAYFLSLARGEAVSLASVMEANFRFNLSLDEYATLCHRSLSSFKRDFRRQFREPPGKWLIRKRLDHAAALLRTTGLNVTEIAFESGFEDLSHFSRVFKERFRLSPRGYRHSVPAAE